MSTAQRMARPHTAHGRQHYAARVSAGTGLQGPGRHRQLRTTLRLLVVLMAIVDFLSPGLPRQMWWATPLGLTSSLATIFAAFWLPGSVVLTLALMATVPLIDEWGAWILPMWMSTIGVIASWRPRSAAIVLAAYTTVVLALDHTWSGTVAAALLLAMPIGIGAALRLLFNRRVQATVQISTLAEQVEALRLDERRALAEELSHLLDSEFGKLRSLVAAALTGSDPVALRAALLEVGTSSRTSLARLRQLVATLRLTADATSPEVSGFEEALDLAEDELVSHAFTPEIELADRPGGAVAGILSRTMQAGVQHVLDEASPGARCSIGLERSQEWTLEVSHEGTSTDPSPSTALRRAATELAAHGGSLSVDQDEEGWTMTARLPVAEDVLVEAASPAVGPRAQRRRGPGRIVGTLTVHDDPWLLALRLVCLAGAAAYLRPALGGGSGISLPPLLWGLSWATILVATFAPRLGALALAVLLVASGFLQPPVEVGSQPHFIQVIALVTLVVARHPNRVVASMLAWLGYLMWWYGWPVDDPARLGEALVESMVALPGIALGLTAHHFLTSRQEQRHEIDRLEQERRRVRELERITLAGELHDIVAHQLTSMNLEIQTTAATNDGVRLRETACRVDALLSGAQNDLETLVHLMHRDTPSTDGRATARWSSPARTARAVADSLERQGHQVTLSCRGEVDSCDPTTAHTAARVLREASTNILRHADAGAVVTIDLDVDEHVLEVRVGNDLPAHPTPHPDSTGLGLHGLDERVQLTGGQFSAGPVLRQWRVVCRLPRWADQAEPRTPWDGALS